MKRTSTIFVTFIAAVTLLLAHSVHSASTREDEEKTLFEKEGFTFIGHMSEDSAPNFDSKASKFGTKAISLYLSPRNDMVTQISAMNKCKSLYGDLLFILNDQQFEDVQLATHGLGEPFWTSAFYDDNLQTFAYLRGGMIPVVPHHIRPEFACRHAGSNMGLAVQGSLSTYGLCSARSSTLYRYICRV